MNTKTNDAPVKPAAVETIPIKFLKVFCGINPASKLNSFEDMVSKYPYPPVDDATQNAFKFFSSEIETLGNHALCVVHHTKPEIVVLRGPNHLSPKKNKTKHTLRRPSLLKSLVFGGQERTDVLGPNGETIGFIRDFKTQDFFRLNPESYDFLTEWGSAIDLNDPISSTYEEQNADLTTAKLYNTLLCDIPEQIVRVADLDQISNHIAILDNTRYEAFSHKLARIDDHKRLRHQRIFESIANEAKIEAAIDRLFK